MADMMNNPDLNICKSFAEKGVTVSLAKIIADVKVEKSSDALVDALGRQVLEIESLAATEQVTAFPPITAARKAYKTMGKDPSRYRSSAEALRRRLVQGKGMYHVNNVVDTGNLVSIQSGLSLGAYNVEKIQGSVLFRTGDAGETYKAIGRGPINLEFLPLFADEQGPFGSPTSDSERTMIGTDCTHLMMVLICFETPDKLMEPTERAMQALKDYCHAVNVKSCLFSNVSQ